MADPAIRDPDATRLQRARWYVGETGYVVGGLAGLALLVVGILTLAGVVDGVFLPVLAAALVGLVVGGVAQSGMAPTVVTRSQMRVEVPEDGEGLTVPEALRSLMARHNTFADDLAAAAARLDRVDDGGLADVVRAGRRVAHLAAVDLQEAKDPLMDLVVVDDQVKRAVVAEAHRRAGTAVEELRALLEVLGPVPLSERAERQQQAVDELSALTDWVSHRQDALRTLADGQDGSGPPGEVAEGSAEG